MTAQITILNKKAVAAASDSAVTIGNKKAYNSANKIHQLSDHAPIGVMVYGAASICGVPSETLIKIYSKTLQINLLIL